MSRKPIRRVCHFQRHRPSRTRMTPTIVQTVSVRATLVIRRNLHLARCTISRVGRMTRLTIIKQTCSRTTPISSHRNRLRVSKHITLSHTDRVCPQRLLSHIPRTNYLSVNIPNHPISQARGNRTWPLNISRHHRNRLHHNRLSRNNPIRLIRYTVIRPLMVRRQHVRQTKTMLATTTDDECKVLSYCLHGHETGRRGWGSSD